MPCLKFVASTVPEKTVTQIYPEKTVYGHIKGKIRAMSPILSPTNNTLLSICIPSFKIVASVGPEKTMTHAKKKKKKVTDLRNYGRTKSSIVPLFQCGAIKKKVG